MAGIETLDALFEHELKDIYDAESRLVTALKEQVEESTTGALKNALNEHVAQTEAQVERVEQVFQILGKPANRGAGCEGMQGLIAEHDAFKRENPSADILDAFILTAAAKVERYEITAYEGLIRMAEQLGKGDAADLLRQNLNEEKQTLEKVKHLESSQDLLQKIAAETPGR